MATSVNLRIRRYNPETNEPPHWQDYEVRVDPGDVMLAALMRIREEQDGSLAFRASCRSGICGSDGMVINGRSQLSCKTQVADVMEGGDPITVEPLRNLDTIKDLVVDQGPFWRRFEQVFPWLMPNEGEPEPREERRMTMPEGEFAVLSKASDCIFCQICYSACPIVGLDDDFLGPQALIKAFRFEADPRDDGTKVRTPVLNNPEGVWRCRTTFNCTDACPKGIPITLGIQRLKQEMVLETWR